MTGDCDPDDATQELLEALDVLYPLPDDATRVERAGRTAYALKQWMVFREAELLTMIPKAIQALTLHGQFQGCLTDGECHWIISLQQGLKYAAAAAAMRETK